MKFLILLVLIILVAPSIAKQFQKDAGAPAVRRGLLFNAVRRFGPRAVLAGVVVLLVALAVVAYLLVRRL